MLIEAIKREDLVQLHLRLEPLVVARECLHLENSLENLSEYQAALPLDDAP